MSRWEIIIPAILFALIFYSLFVPKFTSDGNAYYQYLRTVALDGDLNFYNDRFYGEKPDIAILDVAAAETSKAVTGYAPNAFAMGTSISWIPFFSVVHLFINMLNILDIQIVADGYSYPYLLFLCWGSATYALIGIILLYCLLRRYFTLGASLFAIICILYGTQLSGAVLLDTTLSHCFSFFSVVLFFYLWLTLRDDLRVTSYMLIGIAAGLMVIARWQNSVFLLIVLLYAIKQVPSAINQGSFPLKRLVFSYLWFGIALVIIFSPNMLYWLHIYGSALTIPQGGGSLLWFKPAIYKVLFSGDHGLFSWHPINILGLAGLLLMIKRRTFLAATFLLCFLMQLEINGAYYHWGGGKGFGMRRFINTLPFISFGLASAYQSALALAKSSTIWLQRANKDGFTMVKTCLSHAPLALLIMAAIVLIAWNILVLGEYYAGTLAGDIREQEYNHLLNKPWEISVKPLIALLDNSLVLGGYARSFTAAYRFPVPFRVLLSIGLLAWILAIVVTVWNGFVNEKILNSKILKIVIPIVIGFFFFIDASIIKAGSNTRLIYEFKLPEWQRAGYKNTALYKKPLTLRPLRIGRNSPYQGRTGTVEIIEMGKPITFNISNDMNFSYLEICSHLWPDAKLAHHQRVATARIKTVEHQYLDIPILYGKHTYRMLTVDELGNKPSQPAVARIKTYDNGKAYAYYNARLYFPEPIRIRSITFENQTGGWHFNLVGFALGRESL